MKCRFCEKEFNEKDSYVAYSDYSFVESCNKPECMEKTDERVEELIWIEENEED